MAITIMVKTTFPSPFRSEMGPDESEKDPASGPSPVRLKTRITEMAGGGKSVSDNESLCAKSEISIRTSKKYRKEKITFTFNSLYLNRRPL